MLTLDAYIHLANAPPTREMRFVQLRSEFVWTADQSRLVGRLLKIHKTRTTNSGAMELRSASSAIHPAKSWCITILGLESKSPPEAGLGLRWDGTSMREIPDTKKTARLLPGG